MKRIIFALLLLSVVACSKEPGGRQKPGAEVWLIPSPELGAAVSTDGTRAVVDGTQYFPLTQYSLWIEPLDALGQADATNMEWYKGIGYDNILAAGTRNGNGTYTWKFTPKGGALSTRVGLFPSHGQKVKVCAVYPYMSDFDPATAAEIPFEIGMTDATNIDYMYTGPVEVTLPAISTSAATQMSVSLPFKHAMTLLEFQISTTLVGSLAIKTITLKAEDALGSPVDIFALDGKFSAIDGSVFDIQTRTSSMTITYHKKVAYNQAVNELRYTSFGVIVPEIPKSLTDGTKLKVTFEFDYKNLHEENDDILKGLGGELELDLGAITTNSTLQGLAASYRYIYTISIDNFIKYEDYPEVQSWYFEQNEEGTGDKIYDKIL